MSVMIPFHVDTIVIGGGTAGAAIAGRLAERSDQSVLLLEAGPDYGPLLDSRWPDDLLDGRVVSDTHDWGYTSDARVGQPGHRLQRAKVIGGCSSHNGCIALWGNRIDYDEWAAAGNSGWSTNELLPFFDKAATALRVRPFQRAEITPFHAACTDAMVDAGIPAVDDLNSLDDVEGAGIAPVNIYNGTRWNTAFAYLDPVRGGPHLTILCDTFVNTINLTSGRATSVDIVRDDVTATIEAGRIIVCGGAYGSPAVLLRSGIGPTEDLRSLGIETALDLPGVGRNLHDQPSVSLKYDGTELLSARMDEFLADGHVAFTEQSLAKVRSENCSEAFDLHIYPTIGHAPNRQGRWECVISVANMVPRSRGRLFLRSNDPMVTPVVDTGYLSDPQQSDIAVLMDGIALTRQIAAQQPLRELIGGELAGSAVVVNRETVRENCVHYYHPVGTCKMGPASDPMAVVDEVGRVYGVDNLYVADASIIPTVPRANTNMPVLMLAERIVHELE